MKNAPLNSFNCVLIELCQHPKNRAWSVEAAQRDVGILEGCLSLFYSELGRATSLLLSTVPESETDVIYTINKTVGCTWVLAQSSTKSSQQQFSPGSHLFFFFFPFVS